MAAKKKTEAKPVTREDIKMLERMLNLWPVAGVEQEPQIRMDRWRVFEIAGKHVLFGRSLASRNGRRSSFIVAVDPQRMRVRTDSGRIYELVGPPGYDDDAQYMLKVSSMVAEYQEVTQAFCEQNGIWMETGSAVH